MIEMRETKTDKSRPMASKEAGRSKAQPRSHGRKAVEPDFNTMAHQFKAISRDPWHLRAASGLE